MLFRGLELLIFSSVLIWFLVRRDFLADWKQLTLFSRYILAVFFISLLATQVIGFDRNFDAAGGAAYPFVRSAMFTEPPSSLRQQKVFALEIIDAEGRRSVMDPSVMANPLATNWRYVTGYHLSKILENQDTGGRHARALKGMMEGWSKVYRHQKATEPVSIKLLYSSIRYEKGQPPVLEPWRSFP